MLTKAQNPLTHAQMMNDVFLSYVFSLKDGQLKNKTAHSISNKDE